MQKTIYIPSIVIWDEIRDAAEVQNRSVSNYLINLHLEFGRPKGLKKRIIEMANGTEVTFSENNGPPHEGHPDAPVLSDVGSVIDEPDPVVKVTPGVSNTGEVFSSEELMARANELVEVEIKKAVGEKAAFDGFFNPHSKEYQTRKKKK